MSATPTLTATLKLPFPSPPRCGRVWSMRLVPQLPRAHRRQGSFHVQSNQTLPALGMQTTLMHVARAQCRLVAVPRGSRSSNSHAIHCMWFIQLNLFHVFFYLASSASTPYALPQMSVLPPVSRSPSSQAAMVRCARDAKFPPVSSSFWFLRSRHGSLSTQPVHEYVALASAQHSAVLKYLAPDGVAVVGKQMCFPR